VDSQRGRAKLHREAALTLLATGMLFLELSQIVDLLVNDDPKVVGLVVRGNVAGGEGLGHVGEMQWDERIAMEYWEKRGR